LKQAAALEAAGKFESAAEAYDKAAKAFETAGQKDQQAAAMEKSAAMYEKLADQLLHGTGPKPNTVAPKPAPAVVAPVAAPQTTERIATGPQAAPPQPLESSAIVSKNPKGQPAVAAKNGKPIEGLKLSRHDSGYQQSAYCRRARRDDSCRVCRATRAITLYRQRLS
jgi:hypothetical protein